MKELQEVIKPEMLDKIKDYQIEGSQCGIDNRYVICGDEMGLGKTLQGIIVSLRTGLPTIVICPSYLKYNWEKEYEKWALVCPSILVCSTSDVGSNLDIFTIIICSYRLIAEYPHLLDKRDVILSDEVHYLKTLNTKRWKGVDKYLQTHTPEYFFGMSGTPVTKNVLDWYAPLRLLSYCPDKPLSEEDDFKPVAYNGASIEYYFPYQRLFNRFFANVKIKKIRNKKTGRMVKIEQYEGSKNLDRLRELLKGKYFRRLAKDYLTLPELFRKDIIIDHDVDEDLERAWEKKESDPNMATSKRFSAQIKAPHTARYVRELLEEGQGPIVVYSDHRNPLNLIKNELKNYKIQLIHGNTSVEERQQAVDKFQQKELDLIIATIESFNTGVTLTEARHMVFNDLSWKPSEIAQAEKRIHRIGQDKSVIIHRIIKGAVDERIVEILTSKVEEISKCT